MTLALNTRLSNVQLDGANAAQKAGRFFAGRNKVPLCSRDLCHLLNKHMEGASKVHPMVLSFREHLFTKESGFLKQLMFSSRLQEKLIAAQLVVLKNDKGILKEVLRSYSHSSVRFSGETDSLVNCCYTCIACTMVSNDESEDMSRKPWQRKNAADTRDAVFMCAKTSICMGGYTDIMVLWQFLVKWGDLNFRDLSKLDYKLDKFKTVTQVSFEEGKCFTDCPESKGLYINLIIAQICEKSSFWCRDKFLTHFNHRDVSNSKAAREAQKALVVVLHALYDLSAASCNVEVLENCFRIFHLERWMMIFDAQADGASAECKAWAERTLIEWEKCHSRICNARGWSHTWFSFRRLATFAVAEWRLRRPDEDVFAEPTEEGEQLGLLCWQRALALCEVDRPSMSSERKKLNWFCNLCHTSTSRNERALRLASGVWKRHGSFLSRQALDDAVVINYVGPRTLKDLADFIKCDSGEAKIVPKEFLVKCDKKWREVCKARFMQMKCPAHLKRIGKKNISKKTLKATHFASVKALVSRHMAQQAAERRCSRNDATIFGLPVKRFEVKEVDELMATYAAVAELVTSFKGRYKYKRQEQVRRDAGVQPYEDETTRIIEERSKKRKAVCDVEDLRRRMNVSETKIWVMSPDHPFYVDVPDGVAPCWSLATVLSDAHVVLTKDLAWASFPNKLTDKQLAMCMLLGLRVALPTYVMPGASQDAKNTSIKFKVATLTCRGVVLTAAFQRKHPIKSSYVLRAARMNADGKGWQTISEDDVDTWTSKTKKVTVLDCMASLFDAVLDDASYDRARSLRGSFQKRVQVA